MMMSLTQDFSNGARVQGKSPSGAGCAPLIGQPAQANEMNSLDNLWIFAGWELISGRLLP